MKRIYEASNAVEAHMICDLLQQEGIGARVHGEYLQGAVGELPAAGLVGVVVEEADEAAARQLVERWERAQPAQAGSPVPPRGRGARLFFIGLAIGIAGTAAFLRAPTMSSDLDHNGDGRIDEKWVYSPNGTVLKSESDRNFDRKLDYVSSFRDGVVHSGESDEDFDGSFETHWFYSQGSLLRSESDTDGDTIVDLRTHFSHGVPSSLDLIDPHTGRVRRTEYFQLGKTTHADLDTDGDGRMDTRVTYDKLHEVSSRRPL